MRIAISGAHGAGKSTLAEDFVQAHREYSLEPEPYEWLETYGETIGVTADDFLRQLEISVARLRTFEPGANVVIERSPLDFVAYILALIDLGRVPRDCAALASAVELSAEGMRHVDLLVVLPLERIDLGEEEDLELRDAMNDRLLELATTDQSASRVVEIAGTREERLLQLERAR